MKNIQLQSKNTVLFFFILLSVSLLASIQTQAHWNSKGPFGGKVNCIAIADTNLYLGTRDGGVFRSVNSKVQSWKAVNTGLKSGKILCLATLGRYTFAGTEDSGIFASKDIGNNWANSSNGLTNFQVNTILVSGSEIYAGTHGKGVFKSLDSGHTWTAVNTGIGTLEITALAQNGTTLYAGTIQGAYYSTNRGVSWNVTNVNYGGNVHFMVVSGDKIFSADGDGISTASITNYIWKSNETGLEDTRVNGLFTKGDTIFAATDSGVYYCRESNIVWQPLTTGIKYPFVINALSFFKGAYYACSENEGMYVSKGQPDNWKPLNNGLNNLKTTALLSSGSTIIGATDKGVFVSRDIAANYYPANKGLTDSLNVTCLAFAGSKLYAGTMDSGLFVSADTGRHWQAVPTTWPKGEIFAVYANTSRLYVVSHKYGSFCSPLSGISWTRIMNGPPVSDFNCITGDSSYAIIGATGSGVYMCKDGMNWIPVLNGLTSMNVTALAISGGMFYAGTKDGGVFATPKAAIDWKAVNTGLPSLNITSLGVSGPYILAGYRGGVFATSDSGKIWRSPNILQYIPTYAEVTSFAFTTARVFISTPYNSFYSNALAEMPSGIADQVTNSTDDKITVYPNPSNGNFNVKIAIDEKAPFYVTIFDCQGKVCAAYSGSQLIEIEFKGPKGLYFVRVRCKEGISSHRIVIQ